MTGFTLFIRSRRLLAATIALVVLHLAAIVARGAHHQPREGSDAVVPWLIFLPLVSACIVTLYLRSTAYDLDLTAARWLGLWRVGYVLLMLAIAAVASAVLMAGVPGPAGEVATIRNLLGLTGLAMLAGRVLGSRHSWTLPTIYVFATVTFGNPAGHGPSWDWAIHYDADTTALYIAVLLLTTGLLATLFGAKDVRAEID